MKVVCILFSSLAFEEEKDRSPFLSKKLNVSNGDVFSAYLPRTWSSRQICIYWPTWERLFDILTSLVDSSHYKYFFSFIFIFHHQRCLRVSLHFYSLIFFPLCYYFSHLLVSILKVCNTKWRLGFQLFHVFQGT